MAGACQVALWVRSRTGNVQGAKPIPEDASLRPHKLVRRLKALSSLFQKRYDCPCGVVYMYGSIDPPRSSWQTSGAEDVSTNGPVGAEAVATEMHWRPDDVWVTV